jgi:hypothetical protein
MTAKQVLERGFSTRREHGSPSKLAWINQESARRFTDLRWSLEARRLNIRTAHRKWCRRNGKPFHSPWYTRKLANNVARLNTPWSGGIM